MAEPKYVATGSDDGVAKVWGYHPDRTDNKVVCECNLIGHKAGITSISWCPPKESDNERMLEEDQILTSSKDQTCKVWRMPKQHGHPPHCVNIPALPQDADADEGLAMKTPPDQHTDYINSACWRPRGTEMGKQILSCSDDGTAKIWGLKKGDSRDPVWEQKHKLKAEGIGHTAGNAVSMATWSYDGNKVLTCAHDQLCIIWSSKNGHHIKVLPASSVTKDREKNHQGPIWSALFSPDGHEIVTASRDTTARVWDCNTGQCILSLHDDAIEPRGVDGTVKKLMTHRDVVFGAVWNQFDGNQILTCSLDGTAKLWDKRDRKVTKTLCDHTACVWSASFGNKPDAGGRMILTCSHDMSARVYDQRLDDVKNHLQGHTGILWQASFCEDDQYVVTCSEDRTARLWDLSTGTRRPHSFSYMCGFPAAGFYERVKRVLGSKDGTMENSSIGVVP